MTKYYCSFLHLDWEKNVEYKGLRVPEGKSLPVVEYKALYPNHWLREPEAEALKVFQSYHLPLLPSLPCPHHLLPIQQILLPAAESSFPVKEMAPSEELWVFWKVEEEDKKQLRTDSYLTGEKTRFRKENQLFFIYD